jgi:hypothetical protein
MVYIVFYMRVLTAAIVPEFGPSRTTDLKLGKTASTLALWICLREVWVAPFFLRMITILINIWPTWAYTKVLKS